jgi:hypothetical protein
MLIFGVIDLGLLRYFAAIFVDRDCAAGASENPHKEEGISNGRIKARRGSS